MKIILFILLTINFAQAEERLKFSQVFTEIPATSKESFSQSFSKEALPYWGVILSSTALLYKYDEEIYSELQKKGRDWRIGNQDNTRAAVSFGGQEIVRLPSDTGSFMYFLGDGWMHASISAGFVTVGALKENNYHYNTGIILFHGMVTSTIFNQALKRSFGRESPEVSTSKRGSWNLFPNFNDYNSKTASYDAMPSGHVMTATLTFTILAERYPDQTHIIYLGSPSHQQELKNLQIPFPTEQDNANPFNLNLPADHVATSFLVMTVATWGPEVLVQVGAICVKLETGKNFNFHEPLLELRQKTMVLLEQYLRNPDLALKEQLKKVCRDGEVAYSSHDDPDSEESQAVWDTLGAPWCAAETICSNLLAREDFGESEPAASNPSWIKRESIWTSRAADQAAKWSSELEVQEAIRKELIEWVMKVV